MSGTIRIVILLLALAFPLETAYGLVYRATVSREAQDLYRVEYTSPTIYIKTNYCYVYAYYEDAVIDTVGMEIHFLDSDDTCDIEQILVEHGEAPCSLPPKEETRTTSRRARFSYLPALRHTPLHRL